MYINSGSEKYFSPTVDTMKDKFLFRKKAVLICWMGLFIALFLAECNRKEGPKKPIFTDSLKTPESTKTISLVLKTPDVITFFKEFPESDSLQKEVITFYERRQYHYAWFNSHGMVLAAPVFYKQLAIYRRDFADNSLNNTLLDTLIRAVKSNKEAFLANNHQTQQLELLLTTSFFKHAQKEYDGITQNPSDLQWYIPRKKKNYQVLLDSIVSIHSNGKVDEPLNVYYVRLKEKLRLYRAIEQKGGFSLVVTNKKRWSLGEQDSCIINVKKHLNDTKDLEVSDNSILFTDSLAKAIQHFQKRMGLKVNGVLDIPTLTELNRPVAFRIQQIMVNMERLRWIPIKMEDNYILINIPEFKLHLFENANQIWATNVVVGKAATKTSIFRGNMSHIVLNPYWSVPMSIGKKEILPHLKHNPNYLSNNNMEVLSGDNVIDSRSIHWKDFEDKVPFTFRQKPGKNNALGKMKFLFPNNFNIYLHDTPSKNLFGESKRAFSHGCIRVENPKQLAVYLLKKMESWDVGKIDEVLATNQEKWIQVRPNFPVYIAYFTAWVDEEGQLNFRNDIYHLDQQLIEHIFEKN
jgi:L,D-transpeptidase YcbB